jgi:hypothetical protein
MSQNHRAESALGCGRNFAHHPHPRMTFQERYRTGDVRFGTLAVTISRITRGFDELRTHQ